MLLGMILVTLAALILLVGTVTFLWEVLKKISSDDVKSFHFFLTFVVVFVPLFILISFGGAAVIYDATASQLNMLHRGVVAAETSRCPK